MIRRDASVRSGTCLCARRGSQDRTASLMLRAGYATATTAKLFEAAHKAKEGGKQIDEELYKQAKD